MSKRTDVSQIRSVYCFSSGLTITIALLFISCEPEAMCCHYITFNNQERNTSENKYQKVVTTVKVIR